uniref:NAD(P)H-flavin reductase n=1 Tax=Thaumasiovibrio occultus TaxID=1891184 RepID=UPI000B35F96B|nr:NAD(P)H-flavin reductase [Thaumasiovibrio occultus]
MTIQCKVKSVAAVAPFTYRVVLTPPTPIEFKAGQYLQVCLSDDDKRPFSIANPPGDAEIELHIGAAEENPWALQVVERAKACLESGETMTILPPQGDAHWRGNQQRPLLLIAGGTGFTYVRSILLAALEHGQHQPVFVYWGARDREQLYAHQAMLDLASDYPQLNYVAAVELPTAEWEGKAGNILDAVAEDFVSLDAYDIYICGRFEMAGAARERFCAEKGAHRDHMYADAFAFI